MLLITVLGFAALMTAITQFKSLTGVACVGIMGATGWYCAASITPPEEYEAVNVQIVHVPLANSSETIAVAKNPATGKNVVWRYEGKPEDRVRAFFPNKGLPRFHLTGIPVDENKPRLVKEN